MTDFNINNYEITITVDQNETDKMNDNEENAEVLNCDEDLKNNATNDEQEQNDEQVSEEVGQLESEVVNVQITKEEEHISDAETSEAKSVDNSHVISVPLRPISHPPKRKLSKDGDLFARWVFFHLYHHRNLQPEKIAIIEEVGEARCVTYGELVDGAIKTANYLSHHGIKNGDRIVMCMENSVEYIFYQLGAYLLGATPILLNPSHTASERFDGIICKAAVVDFEHYGHMLRVSKTVFHSVEHIFILAEDLSQIYVPPHVWIYDGFGFLDFPNTFKQCMPMHDSDVIIFSTSGTISAKAKFVAHTSRSAQLLCRLYYDKLFDLLVEKDPDYTSINGHHLISNGLHCHDSWAYLNYVLVKGETCILAESTVDVWRASFLDRIAGLIEQYKIPLITSNSQLLKCFIKYEVQKIYNLSSLKIIANTGSVISPNIAKKVKNLLNVSLTQGYSAAEFGIICFELFDEGKEDDLISCGLPLYNMKIKVANIETEKEVENGEWGQVMINGDCLFRAYLSDQEEKICPKWFQSGDYGMLNQKESLFIGGPVSQLLEVKGKLLSPELLECILSQHKTVDDAVVMMNERELWCGVLLKQENIVPTAERLDKLLKKYNINANIDKVIVIDFIPRSESGKILRNEVAYVLNSEQDDLVLVDNTESYV